MSSPRAHFSPTRFLPVLLAMLTSGLLLRRTQAQVTVQAGINPPEIAVGDHAQLSIHIRGISQVVQQPEITIPDLEVQPAGTAQSVNIGPDGKAVVSAAYTYLLSAEKAGEYEIDPLDITVEGQVYKTQPLKLKVVEGNAVNDQFQPILKLETGKTEVYEGEVFPLAITLLVHQNSNLTDLPFPQLPRENFAMKRFQRNPDQNIVELNGAIYRAFNYRTSLNAIKSGDLELGPAEAKVDLLVPDGSGRRDPFGGISARQRTFKIKSNPLTIKVKPLPTEGKPEVFAGAVGNFTVQIQAQPLKVVEGDPIAATVYVNGTGNFESITAPEMESQEGWRLYTAKLVQENRNSGLESGTVAFSQVLIPDRVTREIPPFALAFFNPDTGTYSVAKSDPIPVQIIPNPTKNAATAQGPATSGIRDFSFEDKSAPGENLTGLLGIQRKTGPLLPLTIASSATIQPWIFHGIGGAILASILAVSGLRKWKSKAMVAEKKSIAPPKAAEILKKLRSEQGSVRAFYAQASEFLSAWQRENNRAFPATPAVAEAVKQIQLRRDFYCYGAVGQADQPVPSSEHAEIMEALKQF